MLIVVCWKWKPFAGYHSTYTADHVNRLASMVSRNLKIPHRIICMTDDPSGIASHIEARDIGPVVSKQRHPKRPNCYRRLRAFSADAHEWFGVPAGSCIMSIDLDAILTRDITPLATRPEDFVIYGDTAVNTPYNGSLWLLRLGSRLKVWRDFDPDRTPRETERLRMIGSDQAAIAAALGPNEARFTERDGVHYYSRIMKTYGGKLPAGTRIVFFIGPNDPAKCKLPWAVEHYR